MRQRTDCNAAGGFTLLELLVATLLMSLLLGSLAFVLNQLNRSSKLSPWTRYGARYARVADTIAADVRGLVRIKPLPEGRSEHGRPVARFLTTHRVHRVPRPILHSMNTMGRGVGQPMSVIGLLNGQRGASASGDARGQPAKNKPRAQARR
jgi:prepilin-type N-terminal cleavage/methylation domain-containing protein